MSESSKRGRDFETSIAQQMRRKGFKAYRDKRSGAGDLYKADIAAPGFFGSIEAKSQNTIKLLDWWRQTVSACSTYKTPLLAIDSSEGELLVMRLDDFLNLVKELEDDAQLIRELRDEIKRVS